MPVGLHTRHSRQHSATVSDGMDGGFKRDVSCELVSDVVSGNPIGYRAFIGVFQGYNVPVWYPVFARKVSGSADVITM